MAVECVEEEAVHVMVDRKQRKGPGITFKGTTPLAYFLQ
jgi:hypothetical protein